LCGRIVGRHCHRDVDALRTCPECCGIGENQDPDEYEVTDEGRLQRLDCEVCNGSGYVANPGGRPNDHSFTVDAAEYLSHYAVQDGTPLALLLDELLWLHTAPDLLAEARAKLEARIAAAAQLELEARQVAWWRARGLFPAPDIYRRALDGDRPTEHAEDSLARLLHLATHDTTASLRHGALSLNLWRELIRLGIMTTDEVNTLIDEAHELRRRR
jgi:hypothetical protein